MFEVVACADTHLLHPLSRFLAGGQIPSFVTNKMALDVPMRVAALNAVLTSKSCPPELNSSTILEMAPLRNAKSVPKVRISATKQPAVDAPMKSFSMDNTIETKPVSSNGITAKQVCQICIQLYVIIYI
jgi:hypothetical protein